MLAKHLQFVELGKQLGKSGPLGKNRLEITATRFLPFKKEATAKTVLDENSKRREELPTWVFSTAFKTSEPPIFSDLVPTGTGSKLSLWFNVTKYRQQ